MTTPDEQAGLRWLGLVGTVIGAMLFALLIQWLLVKPYRIPSASMVPTLDIGERVLVDRFSNRFSGPQVGDIWVFHPPSGADLENPAQACATPRLDGRACLEARPGVSEQTFIKRVVGGPGDRIAVSDGHVIRNGRKIPEPYAVRCQEEICELQTFRVPADHYFMMGDNRGDSNDSRYWGPVARDEMIGHAFATYWPVRRIGGL
ncbi:MAG: signal peptidase I [Solirubrobacteraceae bacterium]|nr:signal peptidase I [Solirubrobacteraceae bacterium]